MLSATEKLSDYISSLFASVSIINSISTEDLFFLKLTCQTFSKDSEEYKAAYRILRGVQRGKVQIIEEALVS
ncbi:hypothetical protein PJF56_16515 [Roseofilum sp. BLCC_M91]|uniref:Uncharacterized protein n=1 Tax=Roseofilum halophilum BLCC-M91 TaxID=3022259 RepID=A0ABT7BMP6_9CYAN|nr:hypothetical protein [Roseofilum halophilum]MDJ1180468.1 hypothetical protein [Roseofilum halophilum BLCC-M91]